MINGKQIREVTVQGIKYIDENNVEQFIDFAQCNENYINKQLSPENWESYKKWNNQTDADWAEYVTWVKSHKYVGKRDITAEKPFIEFYTTLSVRFEFDTQDEFSNVGYLISKRTDYEYYTFDLS